MRAFPTLLVVIGCCLPAGAAGMTWHVSAQGDSLQADGSLLHPWPRIQQGLDAAATGDTVSVLPGVYTGTGNRNLVTGGKAIVVSGREGAAVTIIDVEHPGFDGFRLAGTGEDTTTVIQGFTIKRARRGVSMSLGGTAPHLRDCIFCNNSEAGVHYSLRDSSELRSLPIERCAFRDHPTYAVHLDLLAGGGASAAAGVDRPGFFARLTDCQFEENGTAIHVHDQVDPKCLVARSRFRRNDLATFGSVEMVDCDVNGGLNGMAGYLAVFPDHYRAVRCRFSGLTGTVLGGARQIEISECDLLSNPGRIHTAGPDGDEREQLSLTGCRILHNGGGLDIGSTQVTLALSDCLYAGNGGPISFTCLGGGSLALAGCTLAANARGGVDIGLLGEATVTIERTIIAGNDGPGIAWDSSGRGRSIRCCNVWGNAGGGFRGLPDQIGMDGNISCDPRFVSESGPGAYRLREDSPCLPGRASDGSRCGQIGAFRVKAPLEATWFMGAHVIGP
jgi:hypothetical protein